MLATWAGLASAKLGSCILSQQDTAQSTCVDHCFAAVYLCNLRDK